ncbi:hypothetical protein RHGRI_023428 [Rhododendron griersonianum]|uniref:Uncharacterized protein n=1 Tax=Rhododendron griersonianum TaxID=479676 RepID=A0AAV6J3S0_9ERIC|nr:hypothetical protein RHGRI_023428 [Rhododendron griersonianum]
MVECSNADFKKSAFQSPAASNQFSRIWDALKPICLQDIMKLEFNLICDCSCTHDIKPVTLWFSKMPRNRMFVSAENKLQEQERILPPDCH